MPRTAHQQVCSIIRMAQAQNLEECEWLKKFIVDTKTLRTCLFHDYNKLQKKIDQLEEKIDQLEEKLGAVEPAMAEVDVAPQAEGHVEALIAEAPDEGESEQAADEGQRYKKKQKLQITYSKIKKKYEQIEKKSINYSRKRACLQKNINKRIRSNHDEGSRLVNKLPTMIYENDWYVTDIVNIGRDNNNNIALRLCFMGWHNGQLQGAEGADDKEPDYGEFVTLEEKELKEYFHSHADHFQMLLDNFFLNVVTNIEMLELIPGYKAMCDSIDAAQDEVA